MNFEVEAITVFSLKDTVVQTLEGWILSGQLKIGERLPSERILADRMKISRPVLHEALVDLAAKGLVKIEPRRGVYVNDYRTHGSCALLTSLLNFHQDQIDPVFADSLIAMRKLIETETAFLAAQNRKDTHLSALAQILQQEQNGQAIPLHELLELDFHFHLQIALASENSVYPLILNSFKAIYTHLTHQFFSRYWQTDVLQEVFSFHAVLFAAIQEKQSESARSIMTNMLNHGEKYLSGGSDVN